MNGSNATDKPNADDDQRLFFRMMEKDLLRLVRTYLESTGLYRDISGPRLWLESDGLNLHFDATARLADIDITEASYNRTVGGVIFRVKYGGNN
jgi:hypothetical protein